MVEFVQLEGLTLSELNSLIGRSAKMHVYRLMKLGKFFVIHVLGMEKREQASAIAFTIDYFKLVLQETSGQAG